jgi:hypothetical protein
MDDVSSVQTPQRPSREVSQTLPTPQVPKPERGIACPRCGCCHLHTTHTEPLPSGRIRRRRVCRYCGRRVITVERAAVGAEL